MTFKCYNAAIRSILRFSEPGHDLARKACPSLIARQKFILEGMSGLFEHSLRRLRPPEKVEQRLASDQWKKPEEANRVVILQGDLVRQRFGLSVWQKHNETLRIETAEGGLDLRVRVDRFELT